MYETAVLRTPDERQGAVSFESIPMHPEGYMTEWQMYFIQYNTRQGQKTLCLHD